MRYHASDKTEIALAGSTDAGKARHSQIVVLPLV